MPNLILHPSQPVRAPSQLHRRMSARITGWNQVFTQYFHPTSTNMVHNPPWKGHQSMQNKILHPSQPVRDPSQVPSQISPAITGWNQVFTKYFHPTSTNMVHNPPVKVHHSMQNFILHRSQPPRGLSQVPSQISPTITGWNEVSPSIFTERPQKWPTTPVGKYTIRCRI